MIESPVVNVVAATTFSAFVTSPRAIVSEASNYLTVIIPVVEVGSASGLRVPKHLNVKDELDNSKLLFAFGTISKSVSNLL